jgi:hypothetical protein
MWLPLPICNLLTSESNSVSGPKPSNRFMIMLVVILTPPRFLSVVTIPKLSFNASANDVTRFVPPAFFDTQTASCQFGTLCLIHRAINGSACRLSTGHLKKPCICEACRSMVMTCLIPATSRRFASIRAVIAPRCDFFFDCLLYGKYGKTAW